MFASLSSRYKIITTYVLLVSCLSHCYIHSPTRSQIKLTCVFRIIGMLSPNDSGLFRERLRLIDKKIQPGLNKLLWLTKGPSNIFILDCHQHYDKVVTHTLHHQHMQFVVSVIE